MVCAVDMNQMNGSSFHTFKQLEVKEMNDFCGLFYYVPYEWYQYNISIQDYSHGILFTKPTYKTDIFITKDEVHITILLLEHYTILVAVIF